MFDYHHKVNRTARRATSGQSLTSKEPKKTVRYGLETVKYRALLLWVNLPEEYKTATSLNSFKTKTKTGKSEACVCLLCHTYLKNLGFL